MWRFYAAAIAAALAFGAGNAGASDRHAEAHTHGQGRLNLALEEGRVLMELSAPGADIVGFEHEATTPEQKAAMEKAKAVLSNPLALFTVPNAAECKPEEIKFEGFEEEEGEHKHDHAHKEKHEHDHGKHAGEEKDETSESHHTDIHAEYIISCNALGNLTSISFKNYFDAFPGAQTLTVALITSEGAGSEGQTMSRDNPVLSIGASNW